MPSFSNTNPYLRFSLWLSPFLTKHISFLPPYVFLCFEVSKNICLLFLFYWLLNVFILFLLFSISNYISCFLLPRSCFRSIFSKETLFEFLSLFQAFFLFLTSSYSRLCSLLIYFQCVLITCASLVYFQLKIRTCDLWITVKRVFLTRECLVSDFPAGDGKTANLFLPCRSTLFMGHKWSWACYSVLTFRSSSGSGCKW